MATAAKNEIKSTRSPDETRPFADKGQAAVVNVDGRDIIRGTFEPGWRWSDHVKPIAKTDSCEVAHFGYVEQGSMKVRMNDGEEFEIKAGDIVAIAPGHDAWVDGDEACIFVDFGKVSEYAKAQ
jgi:quercetin dioxygenase-like cupin family protein